MKSREELAEAILLQLVANPAQVACVAGGPENVSGWAFALADAFLAACGEKAQTEAENMRKLRELIARAGAPEVLTESVTAGVEKPAQEREPDAVWVCELLPGSGFRRLSFHDGYAVVLNPELADRLLAGRERVRLEVRVVED